MEEELKYKNHLQDKYVELHRVFLLPKEKNHLQPDLLSLPISKEITQVLRLGQGPHRFYMQIYLLLLAVFGKWTEIEAMAPTPSVVSKKKREDASVLSTAKKRRENKR
jgi:hypothetical protein